jgi:hypothetical protein
MFIPDSMSVKRHVSSINDVENIFDIYSGFGTTVNNGRRKLLSGVEN